MPVEDDLAPDVDAGSPAEDDRLAGEVATSVRRLAHDPALTPVRGRGGEGGEGRRRRRKRRWRSQSSRGSTTALLTVAKKK